MTTASQEKHRLASFKRRRALLDEKLTDIHSYIQSEIREYSEQRRGECDEHIHLYEKEINECGASGASRKKKAQNGVKLYNNIQDSLEGLRELGPTLANEKPKTKQDYTRILSNPMLAGGKLSATQLRELTRMFDGTALTMNVKMDEMMDIIATSMLRLHPSSCAYCCKEDLSLITRHKDPRPSCGVCTRSICEACQKTEVTDEEKDDVTIVRVCSVCKLSVIDTMKRFNRDLSYNRQNSKPGCLTRWKSYQSEGIESPMAQTDFSTKNPSKKASQPNLLNNIEEVEEDEGGEDNNSHLNEADDVPADLSGDQPEVPPHDDPLRKDIQSLIEILMAKEARSLERRKKKKKGFEPL